MERLVVAERAASILYRKQQVLRREDRRLAAVVEGTGIAWVAAVHAAETWQRTAMILGDRPRLEAAASASRPAMARLAWRTDMGVEYPGQATSDVTPAHAIAGTSALAEAAAAYGRATQAAVEHAAATAAAARVNEELVRTQRRLRAVRDRWIVQLQVALRELELRLDEHEREELTRTRFHHRTLRRLGPTVPPS
jgi:vacuolar-type H+-ATPase subunit D/Vma8